MWAAFWPLAKEAWAAAESFSRSCFSLSSCSFSFARRSRYFRTAIFYERHNLCEKGYRTQQSEASIHHDTYLWTQKYERSQEEESSPWKDEKNECQRAQEGENPKT
jgi:hypothetical protein